MNLAVDLLTNTIEDFVRRLDNVRDIPRPTDSIQKVLRLVRYTLVESLTCVGINYVTRISYIAGRVP